MSESAASSFSSSSSSPSARSLPPRPDLDKLRKEAKRLLAAIRAGDASALARLDALKLPRDGAALHDAQLILAREYGFPSWRALKEHVETQQRGRLMTESTEADIVTFKAAIQSGDAERVRELLTAVPAMRRHVNDPMFDFGRRPIHAAEQNRELLDVLIDFDADINLRSDWANGPFSVLDDCPEEIARHLIGRGAKLTAHAAARLGWLNELRQMVRADPAVVHEKGGDGQRPLHFAKTAAIADFLLDHGADIDARCVDHHSTAAQYALTERTDVCRHLIQRGATPDIFMAAHLGDEALVQRCIAEQPDCLRAMVGAKGYALVPPETIYNWRLGRRVTPQRVAIKAGHDAVYRLLGEQSDTVVRFLAACAAADAETAKAMLREHPKLVESLNDDQVGCVADAAARDDTAAVRLMLELGFPVGAVGGWDGGTPLHQAAWRGHLPTVEVLLEHNAALEQTDAEHHSTPLGWCCHGSRFCANPAGDYPAVARCLLDAGARPGANLNDATQAVAAVVRRSMH